MGGLGTLGGSEHDAVSTCGTGGEAHGGAADAPPVFPPSGRSIVGGGRPDFFMRAKNYPFCVLPEAFEMSDLAAGVSAA